MTVAARLWVLVLLLVASSANADDPIDSPMYHDPVLPAAKLVPTFEPGLVELWLQALARPESDLKTRAAQTIVLARHRGMPGLEATIAPLLRELGKPDLHPTVRLEIVHTLVELDAKAAADTLWQVARDGNADLRELVEPAAARWEHAPARAIWRERLGQQPPRGRDLSLAIRCLATVKDTNAIPGLSTLATSVTVDPPIRLEAARALAVIRPSGFEKDAEHLATDISPHGIIGRLVAASLLRHHSGAEAVRVLTPLARDTEPAVSAIALTRLVEIDPALVVPLLDSVLTSHDANVRRIGVTVLLKQPSDDHVRRLGDRLPDPHPEVRSAARQALRELARQPNLRGPAIREGTRALTAKDWRGQEQVAILLGQLDHKPAAPRLVELLKASRAEVNIAAAWGLRVLAVPDTLLAALDHVKQRHNQMLSCTLAELKKLPLVEYDRQLTQLVQLFGQTRYRPADAEMRLLTRRLVDSLPWVPPFSPVGAETRAASLWALGLIHEGKTDPELVRLFDGRLDEKQIQGQDDERVRRMAAIGLARIKADALPVLKKCGGDGSLSLDVTTNACVWATAQLTGKPMPKPGTIDDPQRGWFLVPLK